MAENVWKTALTRIAPNLVSVRGFPLDQAVGQVNFGTMVYLLLRGELPSPREAAVMEAILVSSIDHGASPPSTLAARTVASTGASLSASVAAGVLSINRHHGGAIEACMELLSEGCRSVEGGALPSSVASDLVAVARSRKERIPGFGHRLHTSDPRAIRLLQVATTNEVAGVGVKLASEIAEKLSLALRRQMPLNVDGAIAALLVDLGFEPAVGNGFFLMARMPGLVAHVLEEKKRQKPMRRVSPTSHSYDGPPPRGFEEH